MTATDFWSEQDVRHSSQLQVDERERSVSTGHPELLALIIFSEQVLTDSAKLMRFAFAP
jgi:hypothetical protein